MPPVRLTTTVTAVLLALSAGACGNDDERPAAAAPTTVARSSAPARAAQPLDRDVVARELKKRFGSITLDQARCGVARLDDAVLAAFAAAGYELSAMDEADAALVYQAGLACIGAPVATTPGATSTTQSPSS